MTYVAIGSLGILCFVIFILMLWASRVQTVGPNEALIISGRANTIVDSKGVKHDLGFRIVKGGRSFVWPVIEKCEKLSLELITLDVQTPEVVTKLGVPIIVEAVAQIKVRGEELSIITAAEQFLGKTKSEVMNIALQSIEGHLRGILGNMEVEAVIRSRDEFAQKVQEVSAGDLSNMGLQVVSFTIKDIRDKHGYLDALGKKRIAEAQRDASVGQADALRDAEIRQASARAEAKKKASEYNREAEVTKLDNDTQIAEANRDFRIKNAAYEADCNKQKAEADRAYDLQKFKIDQNVKKEELQIEVVAKQKEIEIQQQEILRRENELIATVERPAEAEKKRVELYASAEQFKLKTTAEGESESTRMRGLARADVERAEGNAAADVQKAKGMAEAEVRKSQGFAEAEVIKARGFSEAEVIKLRGLSEAESRKAIGLAEAEAMEKKAQAWQSYSDAAISQMFIDKLPEIVHAVTEPLAKTEKIVMISNGSDGIGPSKLSKEVIDIVTQIPPALEALTGVNLHDLVARVKTKPSDANDTPAPVPSPKKK